MVGGDIADRAGGLVLVAALDVSRCVLESWEIESGAGCSGVPSVGGGGSGGGKKSPATATTIQDSAHYKAQAHTN